MNEQQLLSELRSTVDPASDPLPLPGSGRTAVRHHRLLEVARRSLPLARLAEAHWDAVAILAEAGREPVPGATYGVWASEKPGRTLTLEDTSEGLRISGTKLFCSGAGLVDRALLTVGESVQLLFDVDLRSNASSVAFDDSVWKVSAFAETCTAKATFTRLPVQSADQVGPDGFYLARPGFWHGACGPASCWAGGAAGILDYAMAQGRSDAHTLAHLGAMYSSVWALRSFLETAGREIDEDPGNASAAHIRALTVRHLVEQACTEVLRRLPRAYGPYPLAMETAISSRYQELDIYLRQSHAERDLEALGSDLAKSADSARGAG